MLRQLRATWRTLRAALAQVRLPLAGLLVVLIGGVLVFWLVEGRRPIEAFFYTLNLITLQAGGDAAPKAVPLQIFALVVLVGGVLALTGGATRILQLVTDPKQRQLALASTLQDHVIVCGIGRVGYRVINELLQFDEKVVAINATEKEEWLEHFPKRGVVVIIDDARQRQTLVNAGVARASAIIACTSDDLANLDIALDAREVNPKIKIVLRMFDTALAAKIAKSFDIQTVLSVSALAAPALATAATRAKVDYAFKLKGQLLNVTTITFAAGSPFVGQTIGQLETAFGCSVISQEVTRANGDEGLRMAPPQDQVIAVNARFNIVGPLGAIRRLHENGRTEVKG